MKILKFGRNNKNTNHDKKSSSKPHVTTITETPSSPTDDGKQRFLDGANVVKIGRCPELIDKIKEGLDCGPSYFSEYYLPVIHAVASYCQSLPASKNYHHTYPYGLIEHTLEVAMYSIRATRAYIYNPTGNEEDIDDLFHAYQYSVFLAAMHHDLGKVITDYRIEVRNNSMKHFVVWSPIKSLAPSEASQIEYRFSRRISEDGKNHYNPNSHNIASTSLLCRTVPSAGIDWLVNLNPFLEIHLYHAIAGDYVNAREIGSAVRDGDMNSTKLGKNAVFQLAGGDDGSIESVIRNAVTMILSEPDTYGLILNKPHGQYCNAVRTYGKVFVAEHTMQQLIRPFVQEAKLSIPSNKVAWTKLIVDSCGMATPSEDTMWWVLFTEQGVNRPESSKDIAYIVFPDTFCQTSKFIDSGLYPHYSPKTGQEAELPILVSDEPTVSDPDLQNSAKHQNEAQLETTKHFEYTDHPQQMTDHETVTGHLQLEQNAPFLDATAPQITQPTTQPSINETVSQNNGGADKGQNNRKRRNSKVAGKLPKVSDVIESAEVYEPNTSELNTETAAQLPNNELNQELPQDLLDMQVTDSDFSANEMVTFSYERLNPKLPRGLIVLKKGAKVDNKLIKEFLPRVQQFIETGQLPFNQKNAPIHVLDEGIFFALPSAFLEVGPFGHNAQNYKQMLQDSTLTVKSSHKYHSRLDGASLVTIRLGQEDPKNLNGVLLAVSGFTYKGKPLPLNSFARLLQDENSMPDFKTNRPKKPRSGVKLTFR